MSIISIYTFSLQALKVTLKWVHDQLKSLTRLSKHSFVTVLANSREIAITGSLSCGSVEGLDSCVTTLRKTLFKKKLL